MRIALVSEVFLPAVDGVVTRLRRTLEELRRTGDEVLLIAPAGGPASYAGASILGMPALRLPLYPDGDGYPEKRVSLPGPAVRHALRRFRPDVVHVINPVLLGAGAVYQTRRLRLPLVASYHAHLAMYARYYRLGLLESFGWRYLGFLHNRANLNLGTSRAALDTLAEHGVRRLALWPYGMEVERFRPDARSEEWRERLSGGHPERTILLYVGRLAREKSLERLLPAVRELADVCLAIVGAGPLRDTLERTFAGTPTTFLGLLDGADLAGAYASADMFVSPSVTETLGMTFLEAKASGLPVVAADSRPARELVSHGETGLLYEATDPASLVAAVARLAGDAGLREAMGRAGRTSIAHSSWSDGTEALRGHYEHAVALHAARRPWPPASPIAASSATAPSTVE